MASNRIRRRSRLKSTRNYHVKKKSNQKIASILSLVAVSSVLIVSTNTQLNTSAAFTDKIPARITIGSDALKPPTDLKIVNTRVGETDLTWKASTSSYATGQKVLRSDNVYGPWTTLATLSKTATTYTDKTGGSKQWIYRVEAVYKNWLSESPGFESPPAVGAYFFDSFTGPAGSLDGRKTEDGSSTWQVWKGQMDVTGTGWLNNSSIPGSSLAVVRTPAQNGTMFMNDVDGAEQFILRGKDPQNYILVGGASPEGGAWKGVFEIAEVRNGVKTVLMSGNTVDDNQDMRVEINGSTIKVWLQANKTNLDQGSLFTTINTDFLKDDPTATYFGFGFSRSTFSIADFTFDAL